MPLNPAGKVIVEAGYTENDFNHQIIVYGDGTRWRSALMMRMAEERRDAGRRVLVLTENEDVLSLTNTHDFLVYQPSALGAVHEMDKREAEQTLKIDAASVATGLAAGHSIIICCNQMEQGPKHLFTKTLLDHMAKQELANVTMIYDVTESFHNRKRHLSRPDGINTLNNMLKRAKVQGAEMVFGAESPAEIAVEIAESCGVNIVGLTTSDSRARKIAQQVDTDLKKHRNSLYGLKAIAANEHFVYNHHSAVRAMAQNPNMRLDPMIDREHLMRLGALPTRLPAFELACGYDPSDPDNTRSYRRRDLQDSFEATILEERQTAIEVINNTAKSTMKPAARARTCDNANPLNIANDNAPLRAPTQRSGAKRAKRKSAPRHRLTGIQPAIAMLTDKKIPKPSTRFMIARTIMNSTADKLQRPMDRRITANSIAQRLLNDETMAQCITVGLRTVSLAYYHGKRVSGGACAAALYHASIECPDTGLELRTSLARHNKERNVELGKAITDTLYSLSIIDDEKERAEAQYKALMGIANGVKLRHDNKRKAA